ncbi:MAG TPA: 3-deoxy-8-phosphooctulonate synthase [Tepidisphaeraceae bacterium]|jgi:2-dehydro-3-deoxyphosphooctonate aldolase (KDO 8-P synthase)
MHAPVQLDPSRLFVVAGPCVIESKALCHEIAAHVAMICERLNIQFIFKASFDKANRSSGASFRGPGLDDGLAVLQSVKDEFEVPVLTDIHEAKQAAPAAQVVDVLQVPAFLARQTDLLLACGRTGRTINVKKGQFMSPQEMANAIAKIKATGNEHTWLCERGTFFGYNRLVNDFTALAEMANLGKPVVFDITHSTQQPAGQGTQSGGNPHFSPMLARAAIATGYVDGLFLECHPDPKRAKSDPATMLSLDAVEPLLRQCADLFKLRGNWDLSSEHPHE